MTAPSAGSPRTEVTPPSRTSPLWAGQLPFLSHRSPQEALDVRAGDSVLVVGAHPDDETFGFGASIAELARRGVDVHVMSLTEGESAVAHVGRVVPGLAMRRRSEQQAAASCLHATSSATASLPDGRLAADPDAVQAALAGAVDALVPDRLVCVWWRDPHPDHRAVGEAALKVGRDRGLRVSGFPVWAQHWSPPPDAAPGATFDVMTVDLRSRECRARAESRYTSQISPLADDLEAILPASFLAWRTEMLVGG